MINLWMPDLMEHSNQKIAKKVFSLKQVFGD